MNRPKLEEYWSSGLVFHESDYEDFIEDLEKYCDELEARITHLNKFIDDRQEETIGIIETYEELLDKICSFNALCNLTNWGELRKGFTTKEEWREWLMKNE